MDGECICRRHAVNRDCPKHGYLIDFATIRATAGPSVLDDPEWQRADQERWDRRREQEQERC